MRSPGTSQRFLVDRLREVFRAPLRDDLREPFRGTLAPFSRASLNAIAIACLRLLTRRPDPLFNVPRFLRRIADSTFFEADLPYFAMRAPPRHLPARCVLVITAQVKKKGPGVRNTRPDRTQELCG